MVGIVDPEALSLLERFIGRKCVPACNLLLN